MERQSRVSGMFTPLAAVAGSSMEYVQDPHTCLNAGSGRILIVSNRLPMSFEMDTGEYKVTMSSGGLVSALGDVRNMDMKWIGWPGCEIADAEDRAKVQQQLSLQKCQPVFMQKSLVDLYYNGYSNHVIWPLFHYIPLLVDEVHDSGKKFEAYTEASRLFANAVLETYCPGDIVWINDFHLMLLPAMLRASVPSMKIGFFLHIPFPSYEIFRILPERQQILRGLLASDVVGFQMHDSVRHFRSACKRILHPDSGVDTTNSSRNTTIGSFPVSINPKRFADALATSEVRRHVQELHTQFKDCKIILGIDRLDHIKGIPHKLNAMELFLARNPHWVGRVTLLQIAVPSRVELKEYHRLAREMHEMVGRINGKFGGLSNLPIHYLDQSISFEKMCALYHFADTLIITSVRDGMNLVSLEFIASQVHRKIPGTLILSEFTGAANLLGAGSIRINPWDIDETSHAILQALELGPEKRRQYQATALKAVQSYTSQDWARHFLSVLRDVRSGGNLHEVASSHSSPGSGHNIVLLNAIEPDHAAVIDESFQSKGNVDFPGVAEFLNSCFSEDFVTNEPDYINCLVRSGVLVNSIGSTSINDWLDDASAPENSSFLFSCDADPSLASTECCASASAALQCSVTLSSSEACKARLDNVLWKTYNCTKVDDTVILLVFMMAIMGLLASLMRWVSLMPVLKPANSALNRTRRWLRRLNALLFRNVALLKHNMSHFLHAQLILLFLTVALLVIVGLTASNVKSRLDFVTDVFSGVFVVEKPSAMREELYSNMRHLGGFYFLLGFTAGTASVVSITTEKQTFMQDTLRMAGVGDFPLLASYSLTYAAVYSPFALVLALATHYGGVFPAHGVGALAFFFWSFLVAMVGFCLMVGAFLRRPAPVLAISLGLSFAMYFLMFKVPDSVGAQALACLSAPTCLGISIKFMFDNAAAGGGFALVYFREFYTNDRLTLKYATAMLLFDSVFYVFVAVYLEKQRRVCQPWYFAFEICHKNPHPKTFASLGSPSTEEAPCNDPLAHITVNHLRFTVYERQTISQFDDCSPTLDDPSFDDASVLAISLMDDKAMVHRSSTIYNDLTVLENLAFVAGIKDVHPSEALPQITDLVGQLLMLEKLNCAAGTLSDAQKRKLALAAALLGKYQFVISNDMFAGDKQLFKVVQSNLGNRNLLVARSR